MYKKFKAWFVRRRTIRQEVLMTPQKMPGTRFVARRMTALDIPDVLELEEAVYGGQPWNQTTFMAELQKSGTALYLVMTLPAINAMVAYGGISFRRTEAHITNIAVTPLFQQQGIGRWLMNLMIDQARLLDIHTVSLEVRLDNVHAQALYRSLGFVPGRIRRGYYTDEHADALEMALSLTGAAQQNEHEGEK